MNNDCEKFQILRPCPRHDLECNDKGSRISDEENFHHTVGQPHMEHMIAPPNALVTDIRGGFKNIQTDYDAFCPRGTIPLAGIVKTVEIKQSNAGVACGI